MKKFRITYHHDNKPDVTQEKVLIPHEFYLDEISKEKKYQDLPDEYFTDRSPLYDSISTGYLEGYGPRVKVTIEEI